MFPGEVMLRAARNLGVKYGKTLAAFLLLVISIKLVLYLASTDKANAVHQQIKGLLDRTEDTNTGTPSRLIGAGHAQLLSAPSKLVEGQGEIENGSSEDADHHQDVLSAQNGGERLYENVQPDEQPAALHVGMGPDESDLDGSLGYLDTDGGDDEDGDNEVGDGEEGNKEDNEEDMKIRELMRDAANSPHQLDPASSKYFQPINNKDMWVYSAYFDHTDKGEPIIMAFGIGHRIRRVIYCHVEDEEAVDGVWRYRGELKYLPDSHSAECNFSAANYICRLKPHLRPRFISLTFESDALPVSRTPVIYPEPQAREFTVCYAALYGPYNNTHQLINSIELNMALGAQHFFLYNYSVTPRVNSVLSYYQQQGLLTVLQWPLPTMYAWYYGQNLAVNDCVYRNRNASKYVVIVDTDEFIVPRRHDSWGAMLQALTDYYYKDVPESERHKRPRLGTFSIPTAVLSNSVDSLQIPLLAGKANISMQDLNFITKHAVVPFLNFVPVRWIPLDKGRMKSIVRPDLVLYAGIHTTNYHRTGVAFYDVKFSYATVYHYKAKFVTRRFVGEPVDTSVLRFMQKTLFRLRVKYDVLDDVLRA